MAEIKNDDRCLRYNEGKPPVALNHLSWHCEAAEAYVWGKGAVKYNVGNWLKGREVVDCLNSVQRHVAKYLAGYDVDPENGCHNLAEAICGLKIALNAVLTNPDKWDDRPKKGLREEIGELDAIAKPAPVEKI